MSGEAEGVDRPDQSTLDTGLAFRTSQADRDRTLEALRGLEEALARAAGAREWIGDVVDRLSLLGAAMADERDELFRPDSLLSMIEAESPRRFGPRIRGIREQYDDATRRVASLMKECGEHPLADQDPTDLRHRSASIIRAIHLCRARQTDLVYEALRLDLGGR